MARTARQLYHTKIEIDGRCIELLLTEDDVAKGAKRVLNPKNADKVTCSNGSCWPIEPPPRCSFWDKVLGRCGCT
jgi:hypothetical protein